MRRLTKHFRDLLHDEHGGDAIEYALVAGLIVLLFIGAFVQMADSVGNTFNSVENAIDSV